MTDIKPTAQVQGFKKLDVEELDGSDSDEGITVLALPSPKVDRGKLVLKVH